MKNTYYGNVSDGKLKIVNRSLFDRDIASMDGKQVEIIIQTKKKNRSDLQNRYYWGVVVGMIKQGFTDLGHEDLDSQLVHEFLKGRFCHKDMTNEDTGEVISIPSSTANLSTVDFMTYIDKCVKFGAEFLNIIIPEPNTQSSIWT